MVAKRQVTKRAVRPTRPTSSTVETWLRAFLGCKDQVSLIEKEQAELRLKQLDVVEKYGEEDEKGNIFLDLETPVEYVNNAGKKYIYTSLKKERHLTPAVPTPDATKAEALLKKKGLWLDKNQVKVLQDLQLSCPFVTLTITIDPDALQKALFTDTITSKEYESTLREQNETFQFRPCES
jgi:hypothetical protein